MLLIQMSCLSLTASPDCQPLGNNPSTCRSLLQLHKHYCPSNTGPKDLSVGNRELGRMESLPSRYLAQKEWLRTLYLDFSVPCQKISVQEMESCLFYPVFFFSATPHPKPDAGASLSLIYTCTRAPPHTHTHLEESPLP